jgi:hypothetical protein
MSELDRKAALELALEYVLTCAGINPNGGYKKRSSEKAEALHMGLALRALKASGDGIEWKPEREADPMRMGYDNIYQYIAGDMHQPGASMKVRITNSEALESTYRAGFMQAKRFLMEELGVPLYLVPYRVDDLLVRVITLFPNYPIGDSTAYQVDQERENKRTLGQMTSLRNRQAARIGLERANAKLSKALDAVIRLKLPEPRNNPVLALETKGSV